MSNFKSRLSALEILAKPKFARPVKSFQLDGTPEQAEQIAELERQGVKTITTRVINTDQS